MRFALDVVANDESSAAHIGNPIFVGVKRRNWDRDK